ncbi:pyridoxamine kinase [Neopoerus faecalis]|uniref:pyridoxamine kinase n=1 Tax=Neopoerus faecalis TaxID=3032125 RepID=UPI0025705762|nr:pyridoxamine kinase [Neopoerus faecalis]
MPAPRIAAIHDLSCFGRCSLTIALPVLSAMGCQCCPLPTALLSAHTGISGFTFLDTTDEMRRISAHWSQLSLHFQAIYTGFLGSAPQINLVEDFLRRFHAPDTLLVMDPVMGDHGTPYKTCTPALRQGLRELVAQADVITPNLTEAAILLDIPYHESQTADASELVRALSLQGQRSVVLTGYAAAPGQVGALCYDRDTRQVEAVQTARVPQDFPGTGDLFASVLTGALTRGAPLLQAARTAVDFVGSCVARSVAEGAGEAEGVDFEPLLRQLTVK